MIFMLDRRTLLSTRWLPDERTLKESIYKTNTGYKVVHPSRSLEDELVVDCQNPPEDNLDRGIRWVLFDQ